MACLFGGFWGRKEMEDIQAYLSPLGARLNLAPVHKLKAFGYSLCAAVLVDFLSLAVLIAYLGLVMNVDFGGQIGYVIATCFAGSLVGVSFGALLTAFKGSLQLKTAVMITVNIVMSFLAGMMVADIKYTVTHAVPLLAYINPANLISDALYSLYYYSSHARFFLNFGLLLGFAAVFYLCVYLIIRRQKYASI
jgi:ABC-2 type transport system permease protein